jgi:hypothetical protein
MRSPEMRKDLTCKEELTVQRLHIEVCPNFRLESPKVFSFPSSDRGKTGPDRADLRQKTAQTVASALCPRAEEKPPDSDLPGPLDVVGCCLTP